MSLVLNIKAKTSITDVASNLPIINHNDVLFGQTDMFDNNNAMYFNGTNYLSIASDLLNLGADDFTITFWGNLKWEENTGWNAFFGNYAANSITFWAYGRSGALYSISVNTSDQNRTDSYIIDGTWHYYTVVRKKATLYLYIDGKIKTTFSIGENQIINFAGNLGIGWAFGYGYIKGYISDFVIADSCLWEDNFALPTTYLRDCKFIYLGKDDSVWSISNKL